jgi:TPR repeat protein
VQIPYTESGRDFSEDSVISRHPQLAWILVCIFVPQLAPAQSQNPAPAESANPAPAESANIDAALLAKANAGDATAEVQVGEQYAHAGATEHFLTVAAQDYQQAAAWYRKAADQKSVDGELHLAALYRDGGNGFPRDMEQAAAWYLKAADQGDVGAQGTLGVLYSMGQGVAHDDVEAYFWLDLAASIKGPDQEKYAANRQMIGERITADELAAVQDRIAAWKAAHPRPDSSK